MSVTAPDPGRRRLRQQLRRRRRSLDRHAQREASKGLSRLLRRHPWFRQARRIAFYMASRREGEIDPSPLLEWAHNRGKRCYLPVMRRDGPDKLLFLRHRKGARLRRGPYGIEQPLLRFQDILPARALDLVLMPLVGFDARGNRLGMGKGYYDRTFGFKRGGGRRRPLLVGLAHECQRVEALDTAAWDVPLAAVATPAKIYVFLK